MLYLRVNQSCNLTQNFRAIPSSHPMPRTSKRRRNVYNPSTEASLSSSVDVLPVACLRIALAHVDLGHVDRLATDYAYMQKKDTYKM